MNGARTQADFFQTILRGLRRPPSRSVILLVDHAHPGALPALLRVLLKEHPEAAVLHRAVDIEHVPPGSVVVLLPRRDELEWMNLHRPRFAARALRVVLWCDHGLAVALHFEAPDLFEWVTRSIPCPPSPPPHAVNGLRALLRARVVGCRFFGDVKMAEAVVEEAFPGRRIRTLSASLPYSDLLKEIQRGGPELLCFTEANDSIRVQQVRLVLAQAAWRRPSLLINHGDNTVPCPGWWTLHGKYLSMDQAVDELKVPAAECLAALLGLEPEAVALCGKLLRSGGDPHVIRDALLESTDPGATLAHQAASAGLVERSTVEDGSATPPELRGLWRDPQVRALRRERWERAQPQDAAVLAAGLDPPRRLFSEQGPPETVPFINELILRHDRQGHLPHPDAGDWVLKARQSRSADVQMETARMFLLLDEPDKSLTPFQRALSLREAALGAEHPSTAEAAYELAGQFLARAEWMEAESLLRWAADAWEPRPELAIAAAGAHASIGLLRLAHGRRREAFESFSEGVHFTKIAAVSDDSKPRLLGISVQPELRPCLMLMRQLGTLWLRLANNPWSFCIEATEGVKDLAAEILHHAPRILYLTARGGTGDFRVSDPEDPELFISVPPKLLETLFSLFHTPDCIILDDIRDDAQAQAVAEGAGAAVAVRASDAQAEMLIVTLLSQLSNGKSVEEAVATTAQGMAPGVVTLFRRSA